MSDRGYQSLQSLCLRGRETVDSFIEKILEYAEIRVYKKGRYIMMQGDELDGMFYLLLDGCIEVSRADENGWRMVIGIYHNRGFFGESVFGDRPRYVSVRAMEDSTVAAFDVNTPFPVSLEHQLLREIIKTFEEKRVGSIAQLQEFCSRSLRDRVFNILLDLCSGLPIFKEESRRFITVRITHQELSEIANASRVNVSNALTVIARDGRIRARRGAIDVYLDIGL